MLERDGAAVKRAAEYAEQLVEDVKTMLKVVDSQMMSNGYFPLRGKKLGEGGLSMKDDSRWFLSSVARAYVLVASKKSIEKVSMVKLIEVHLTPTDFDQPVILFGDVTLEVLGSRKEIWDRWEDNEFLLQAMEEAAELNVPFDLGIEEAQSVFSGAASVRATIVPLVSVTNEAELKDLVIDPFLGGAQTKAA